MRPDHPLAELIIAAAGGEFPDADGGWRRVPPWRAGLEAIVSFTGHAVFAVRPDVPTACSPHWGRMASAAPMTRG
jgi:hypothetical protein